MGRGKLTRLEMWLEGCVAAGGSDTGPASQNAADGPRSGKRYGMQGDAGKAGVLRRDGTRAEHVVAGYDSDRKVRLDESLTA